MSYEEEEVCVVVVMLALRAAAFVSARPHGGLASLRGNPMPSQ